MSELPTSSNKIYHSIRENNEQKSKERKRSILLLIHSYLLENNLDKTAECLVKESHINQTYSVCDNVDLDTILQEYTSYYHSKFGKYPKISRKMSDNLTTSTCSGPKNKNTKIETRPRSKLTLSPSRTTIDPVINEDTFEIGVRSLNPSDNHLNHFKSIHFNSIQDSRSFNLEPLDNLEDYPGDWKEMYELISKEIIPRNVNTKWDDCIGLEKEINIIKEAVVYPLDYPEFFMHVSPWKGILLYGPPGTGKTLLARALACESKTIFINVTASCFISKWRGESEKLIRVLFEVARKNSPCTIFIDELDALSSRRDKNQHEASRRFKSELLTQMDGILESDTKIFILATSNLPWEIDPAILRRFDKKIFVDLPPKNARAKMFEKNLYIQNSDDFKEVNFVDFANATENYSGNDIKIICKSALMATVRRRINEHKKKGNARNDIYYLLNPKVHEVVSAIKNSRPSCADLREKYVKWMQEFGGA